MTSPLSHPAPLVAVLPIPNQRVRASTAEDLAAITRIYGHHVLNGSGTFEEEPPSTAEMGRRRDDVRARGLPHLVAERDGQVLGFAYAAPYRLRSAYRYTLEDSVYVAEDRRRTGIGHALLVQLIDECSTQGYRQLIAVIGDSGNTGSIGLHGALGFRHAGTLHAAGFKLGRWVDSVLMQRALGQGSSTPPGRQAGARQG